MITELILKKRENYFAAMADFDSFLKRASDYVKGEMNPIYYTGRVIKINEVPFLVHSFYFEFDNIYEDYLLNKEEVKIDFVIYMVKKELNTVDLKYYESDEFNIHGATREKPESFKKFRFELSFFELEKGEFIDDLSFR